MTGPPEPAMDRASDIEPRRPGPRPVRVTREVRTARFIFYAWPVATLLLLLGPRFALNSSWVKKTIAIRLATRVAGTTEASVRRLGGVQFGWTYAPCLQASEVYRARGEFEVSAKVEQACIERWPSAVGSGFRAVRVRLERPSFELVGGRAVTTSGPSSSATKGPLARGQLPAKTRAPLFEAEVVFADLRLDWRDMPLPARLAAGSFGPIDGTVTVQRRGDLSAVALSIREPRTGMTMRGRATPTPEGWDLTARVEGDLASVFGPLFASVGLDIKKLPVQGDVGVFYSSKDSRVRIDIDLFEFNVDVANQLVSSERLAGFEAREKLRVNVDLAEQRLWIEDGLFELNGIPTKLSVDMRLGDEKPRFSVAAELLTIPMIKLLRSIPGAVPPEQLEDISAEALFALSFTLSGELKDPSTWVPKLEHNLVGIGPMGQGSGLEELFGAFTYFPLTPEGRSAEGRPTGPVSPSWVPYAQIPYVQRRAIQVSEDANFWLHNGIDIEEIKSAVVDGLTTDDRARGGSTITQQLVKNLFLSRDRTALRKVQELLLTFLVEQSLTKEQIFETYANIIEWGPGIFGLREAAQHYFGKSPQSLSAREMAYLATIIPGPVLFHEHYEQGFVPPKHSGKVDFVLRRLRKLGTLKTDEELEQTLVEKIRFTRSDRSKALP